MNPLTGKASEVIKKEKTGNTPERNSDKGLKEIQSDEQGKRKGKNIFNRSQQKYLNDFKNRDHNLLPQ